MKNYEIINTKEEFNIIYEILEDSFPRDELRPHDDMYRLFKQRKFTIYHQNFKVIMLLWNLDTFYYLEYFCVKKIERNKGYGSKMLQRLIEELTLPLILDIEYPNNEYTRNRLSFYQRNGMLETTYDYYMPTFREEDTSTLLRLLSSKELDYNTLDYMKDILFKEVYLQ